MLTDRTRYRLTGTIFLVAVAAVAIPILFDGAGVEPMHLEPLEPTDFTVRPDTTPPPDIAPALAARRELEAEIDVDGFDIETGTRIGEVGLLPDDGDGSGDLKWAVQVASFERRENANARRAALLADGYEAFLSEAKRDGRITTRVAIGPLIDRDDAVRLRSELVGRYAEDAVIVRFSP